MVSFVQNDLAGNDSWRPDDVAAVVAALAAEAGFGDGLDEAVVARGRGLVADGDRCGSCHTFHDNGTAAGSAPDLTGWGARDWLVGIITDPTHERFYDGSNDRMPRFGTADEGAQPPLSAKQIALVADWLRGTWYRPAAAQ
jgi:mono/diheme cytochrome c family protein